MKTTINGNMDGLQVLKGGQGKATVYFSKEMMHGALDLNEAEVVIGSTDQTEDAEHNIETDPLAALVDGLVGRISGEVLRTVRQAYEQGKADAGEELIEKMQDSEPLYCGTQGKECS